MNHEQAKNNLHSLLKVMLTRRASDLFISNDFPPPMKTDGKMTPVSAHKLTPAHTKALAHAAMNEKQRAEFEVEKECNFAISPAGIGRFRVNVFMQQGHTRLGLRTITTQIPNFNDLKLPPVLKDVSLSKRGLVILVGGTGSGEATP